MNLLPTFTHLFISPSQGFPGYSGISQPTYNQFNMGQKMGQRDYAFSVEDTMWIPIFGSRDLQITGTGVEEKNLADAPALLLESKHMIIRRVCLDCTDPRYQGKNVILVYTLFRMILSFVNFSVPFICLIRSQDLYYRRILTVPNDVDIWNIIQNNYDCNISLTYVRRVFWIDNKQDGYY